MKEDQNKNLIWLFLILVVLAVIFFGYYFYKNNSSDEVVVNNTTNKNILSEAGVEKINVDDLVDSIKDEYKNSPEFQECIGMNMGIKSCLKEVVMEKVKETKNVNLCSDLIDGFYVQECKDLFYTQEAEKTGYVSLCEKTTNKDYCLEKVYTKKALDSNDENICNSLTQDYQKQQCKSRVIIKKAIEENNLDLCGKLVYLRIEVDGENTVEVKETMEAEMCKEQVRMEAEMREMEEKMKKELEGDVKGESVEEPVV